MKDKVEVNHHGNLLQKSLFWNSGIMLVPAILLSALLFSACSSISDFTTEADPMGVDELRELFPEPAPVFIKSTTARWFRRSPDGKKICYWDVMRTQGKIEEFKTYALYVADKGGTLKLDVIHPLSLDSTWIEFCPLSEPAWSPDGKCIAFSWSGQTGKGFASNVVLAAYNGKGIKKLIPDERALNLHLSNPAWSPDSRHIAFLARSCEMPEDETQKTYESKAALFLFEPSGKAVLKHELPIRRNTKDMDVYFKISVNWSPDGKKIAALTGDAVYLYDMEGKNLEKVYVPAPNEEEAEEGLIPYVNAHNVVQWSADSAKLLYHDFDSVSVIDIAGGTCQDIGVPEKLVGAVWIDKTEYILAMTGYKDPATTDIFNFLLNFGNARMTSKHVPYIVSPYSGEMVELDDYTLYDYTEEMTRVEYLPPVNAAFSMWCQ